MDNPGEQQKYLTLVKHGIHSSRLEPSTKEELERSRKNRGELIHFF